MEINKQPIKTLEQALSLLSKTKAYGDKAHHEEIISKARIYDFLYKNEKEPEQAELKARIITLEDIVKKTEKERDILQEKYIVEKAKNNTIKKV